MTRTTFAEYELRTMSAENLDFFLGLAKAGETLAAGITPDQYCGFIYSERIRRHSAECSDLECGFNPFN